MCSHTAASSESERPAAGEDIASLLPDPISFREYAKELPDMARPLRIATPCCGIEGAGHAFHDGGVWFEGCNVYDLDGDYREYLEHHFQEATGAIPALHLGAEDGDMLKVKLSDLEGNVDLLIAGFPCPPWTPQGKRETTSDIRFKVCERVVIWILWCAEFHGLLGVCLENVMGTMANIGGFEAFFPRLKMLLENLLKMFRFRIDILEARDYKSPATRTRVLLRGLHVKFFAVGVPPPLPPMGKVKLGEHLGRFPNIDPSTLTHGIQWNLKTYDKLIRRGLLRGTIPKDSIVIVAADRAQGKSYKQQMTVDHAPCLTCHNTYLFLMKACEAGLHHSKRTLYRFVHPAERLHWQGFPAAQAYRALGRIKSVKAAGNCYPVGMMFAGLMPMIYEIASSGVDLTQWPASPSPNKINAIARFNAMQAKAKRELNKRPPKSKAVTKSVNKRARQSGNKGVKKISKKCKRQARRTPKAVAISCYDGDQLA